MDRVLVAHDKMMSYLASFNEVAIQQSNRIGTHHTYFKRDYFENATKVYLDMLKSNQVRELFIEEEQMQIALPYSTEHDWVAFRLSYRINRSPNEINAALK